MTMQQLRRGPNHLRQTQQCQPHLPVRTVGKNIRVTRPQLSVAAVLSNSTETTQHHNTSSNNNGNVFQTTALPQITPQHVVIPDPIPGVLPPPSIFAAAVAAGEKKAQLSPAKILVLGVLAGAFISMGGAAVFAVGGSCPGLATSNPGLQKMLMGLFGLPTFLTMVVVTGTELFTGNAALVSLAALEGRATAGQLAKSWLVSYLGNIMGCAAVVALLFHCGVLSSVAAPLAVATAKSSLTFTQALLRGIAGNWLVCMGIWQAVGSTSFPGKFLSCLLPVSAFVSLGLEHSVANMFMIPMGIALGAPVSVGQFLVNNLIPVTLGNIIGGAVCVAMAFSFAYGRLGKAKQA